MPTPRTRISALLAAGALALVAACGNDGTASVSFSEPNDGDTIAGTVDLTMTADGISIEPAGEVSDGAGHFHVIADAGCLEAGEAVPKDADHLHFGKGQAEGSISLEPGTHELCLQAGDGAHVALSATDTVSLTVGVTSQEEWCATVDEVDDLFAQADTGDLEYADEQIVYENTRRLLAQLGDAIDVVDADVRADLASTIDFGSNFATVLANAASPTEAEAELERIFDSLPDDTLPGSDWILDTCGVDVDD